MYNRYSDQERRHDFGRNDPRNRESGGSRYGDETWRGYRSRPDYEDYDAEDMYGARGDEREFGYEFERGSNQGYRGMSQRESSDRFDEVGGPQRYSSYPQWGRSDERLRGRNRGGSPGANRQYDFQNYGSESEFGAQRVGEGNRRFGSDYYPATVSGARSVVGGQFTGRGPKGYRRSDERIQEDICERLTRHPDIDASEIEIRVKDGEVTLTGTVDQRHCKRMAEDIAENISGVRDVRNEIRVQQDMESSYRESSPRPDALGSQRQMMPSGKSGQSETVHQRKH